MGTGLGAAIYRFDGKAWVLEQILQTPIVSGQDVAVRGDLIVLGSYPDAKAHVYQFDGTTWNFQQSLVASDYAGHCCFGEAVVIGDGFIVVGDGLRNGDAGFNSGGAYIFEFDGTQWVEKFILVTDDDALVSSRVRGCRGSPFPRRDGRVLGLSPRAARRGAA